MAQMQVQGLEEYAERLGSLYKDSEQIIKESVYEGASVVADSIKSGLKSLPVDNGQGTEDKMLTGVSRRQKADLIDAFSRKWYLFSKENTGDQKCSKQIKKGSSGGYG